MSWFVSMLCLAMSCVVMSLESPQILVFCLVMQSFLVVTLMGFLSSIWYSYILFLVFLGGMLVIFVYISSLAAGVKIDYQLKFSSFVFIGMMFMIFLLNWSDCKMMFSEIFSVMLMDTYGVHSLISMWSFILYLFIVGYLLLALYNVCWMMKTNKGPLRALK
uniref:NADH dehydrogenase subunit 6 n=1 Tax=Cylisticus convexus TaxID=96835 RepID=A0A0G2T6A4_9CRUS|nr:NADH dehydrogenase subunit 6 [Cylisticus convexus]